MYLLFDFEMMVSVCGQTLALPNSRTEVSEIDTLRKLVLENLVSVDVEARVE
jgi:hypothetical protein